MKLYKAKVTITLLVAADNEEHAEYLVRKHAADEADVAWNELTLAEIREPEDVPCSWRWSLVYHNYGSNLLLKPRDVLGRSET